MSTYLNKSTMIITGGYHGTNNRKGGKDLMTSLALISPNSITLPQPYLLIAKYSISRSYLQITVIKAVTINCFLYCFSCLSPSGLTDMPSLHERIV